MRRSVDRWVACKAGMRSGLLFNSINCVSPDDRRPAYCVSPPADEVPPSEPPMLMTLTALGGVL